MSAQTLAIPDSQTASSTTNQFGRGNQVSRVPSSARPSTTFYTVYSKAQLFAESFKDGRKWSLGTAWTSFRSLCSLLGTKIKNSFYTTFYVPRHRPEWGTKYSRWSNGIILKKKTEHTKIKRHCRPEDHNHSLCARVVINVSGSLFETQLRTLNKYPETLLGNPVSSRRFYDPTTRQYVFDRHATSFRAVFQYYQTGGHLYRPAAVPMEMFHEELTFYGIPKKEIERLRTEEGYDRSTDVFPHSLVKRKLWLLLEYPESSANARLLTLFTVYVIVVAIMAFCIETLEVFKPSQTRTSDEDFFEQETSAFDSRDLFFFLETTCNAWFTLEFLLRIATCPNVLSFGADVMNWIDLIAILPYYLSLVDYLVLQDAATGVTSKLRFLRILRLVRVLRIFKLSRHFKGLQILGLTLKASVRELGLLVLFLIIGVLVFSTAAYYAESGNATPGFSSILTAFWWGVVTMTTIGYGDIVTKTHLGRVVSSLCAIAGILTIALPVPVIVSNFNYFYRMKTEREQSATPGVNPYEIMMCPNISLEYEQAPSSGRDVNKRKLWQHVSRVVRENNEGAASDVVVPAAVSSV